MPDAITILSAVLVAITGVYVYLTYRMAKASETASKLMKEQADAITRPYVSISLVKRHNNPHIFLRIENTGQTTARDMTLNFGPEIGGVKEIEEIKKILGSYLFTKTLASFPPHSPVFFLLGFGASLSCDNKNASKTPLSIIAKYSSGHQTFTETSWLDVNQYDGSALDTNPIVSALGHIKEEIAKMK